MWEQTNEVLDQSAARVKAAIANFLPGFLALLLVLFVAFLLAGIIRLVLRRFLKSVDFDHRMERWGFGSLSEWSPGHSPTRLVLRLASWTVILIGLLVGVSALDAALASRFTMRLLNYLPNVFAAIVVLAGGIFLSRFLARSVLISAVNMHIQSARVLSLGVKWLVLILAAAMALDHLAIGGPIVRLSFGILFGGIVLALALAVGLGSKDIVSRSLDRQALRQQEDEREEHFQHL